MLLRLKQGLAFGLTVLAAACGGGSGTPTQGQPASPSVLTAIQGPECIDDTSGRWVSAVNRSDQDSPRPPARKFYMAVRYVHAIDTPITSNFGRLGGVDVTNFDPEAGAADKNYGRWQRGKADGAAGVTSGVQMKCDHAGSYIDTATFARQELLGTGPHSVYFFDFRDPDDPLSLARLPAAFGSDPSTELVFQARLEVPFLKRAGPAEGAAPGALAVAQLSMGAYLRDARSGKLFAYVVNAYQNRAAEPPGVAQDEEVAFVAASWDTNEFVTVPPDSAGFSSATWSGLRPYRVHITQPKFVHALGRLNAFCSAPANRERPFCRPGADGRTFSTDPADYQLVAFGMLHEVFHGPDNQVASGAHYKEVGAYHAR